MNTLYQDMEARLALLEAEGNLRSLPRLEHHGRYVNTPGSKPMLNLSSNDYLGLAARTDWWKEFIGNLQPEALLPTSSSSRLLTGNFPVCEELEEELAALLGCEATLLLGCGYHANTGILPAIADKSTLILADKLVHASLIDGIRLSGARCIRYRHNDLAQLERLLAQHHGMYSRIIVVTESIFSMDGDEADLPRLVALKKQYDHVMLYVDEAHAFGVRGQRGMGCAEEQGCISDIDLLVGTFGKAAASAGAFVACKQIIRRYLVNHMRPFIFTTALPPVNVAWTLHVVRRLPHLQEERRHLATLTGQLRQGLCQAGLQCPGSSHIAPLIVGESAEAVRLAEHLQRQGFYALPVRPPTVPPGTARIRFSLTAALKAEEVESLLHSVRLYFNKALPTPCLCNGKAMDSQYI